jgi:hypothetical protein
MLEFNSQTNKDKNADQNLGNPISCWKKLDFKIPKPNKQKNADKNLLECFSSFLATLIFLIFIFYALLVTIFSDTFYVILLQHDICNTLYLLFM